MDSRRTCTAFLLGSAAAVGLLLAGLRPALGAAEALSSQPYKNAQYGFKFHTFQGWTDFPAEPGEKTTIVFFRTAKTGRGLALDATCYVALLGKNGCSSMREYMSGVRRYPGVQCRESKFLKESMLPEGSSQFEFSFSNGRSTALGLCVEYAREQDPIGVLCVAESTQFDKLKNSFIASLASFKYIDVKKPDPDDDKGSLDKKDQLPIKTRYQDLLKSKPPGWEINFSEKFPRYIFYSNCKPEDLGQTITRLRMIRPVYEKAFPPVEKALVDRAAPIVRICKDQEDFMTYSGKGQGVGGYWSPFRAELVVFRKSQILGSMNDLFFEILQHEGYHQYIYYACGEVDPHIIFHEGPAEYFGAMEPAGGTMVPTFKNTMRIGTVKGDVGSGNFVPFEQIFRMTQQQYYADSTRCYAQGWAMTTFMMLGKAKMGAAYKDEWGKIIPTYFGVLQGEVKKEFDKIKDQLKAVENKGDERNDRSMAGFIGQERREEILKMAMDEALKGINFKEMEEAYKQFVKKHL
jgi:hypothetical protein